MGRDCRAIEGMLSAYLDGELTEAQGRRCAEHLAQCADCRHELERLSVARSVLQAMPEPVAPPYLAARIKSSLADYRRPVTARSWPAWATPVAAAATLVLALSVGLLRGPVTPSPDTHLATVPSPTSVVAPAVADNTPPVEVAATPGEATDELAVASLVHAAERRSTPRRAGFISHTAPIVEAVEAITPPQGGDEDKLGFAFGVAADEEDAVEAALAGPSTVPDDEALKVALAPRLSPVAGDPGAPVAATPSGLELELAGGVVASLLVDDFIAEHVIESDPTMLSVVTSTPSAELGLKLADGEDDGRFELCFTDAMRRARAGVEE